MPRVSVDDEYISASKAREFIRQVNWEGLRSLVPDTTYQYLISSEAVQIIANIKKSQSRH
ncbi:citrate lyase synthetase [Sporomusaceae bacterium BoRhaA]|nr:citrate lyase synthetase [Pelorhabdus rhamnosifermentans]